MIRALLIGKEPLADLGYAYVQEAPYDVVVIGSLSLSQLLRFQEEAVLQALADGKWCFFIPRACRNHPRTGPWPEA